MSVIERPVLFDRLRFSTLTLWSQPGCSQWRPW